MATLNNVYTALEQFADKHQQINAYYPGPTWDFQAQTNLYPALIVNPGNAIITSGQITVTITIFIADLMSSEKTNVNEIHSDTLQILGDLFATFREVNDTLGNFAFGIEDNYEMNPQPFADELDDRTAGWYVEVPFVIPFAPSNCGLPITV